MAALRALGAEVLTCTVRRANPKDVVGADQKAEEAATFCILEAARAPHRVIASHLRALRRAPGRWFGALGLAWRTCPPGARAALWQLFYFIEPASWPITCTGRARAICTTISAMRAAR